MVNKYWILSPQRARVSEFEKKHEAFSRYWLEKEGLVRGLGIVAQTKELFALFDKEGSACFAKINVLLLRLIQHVKQEEVSLRLCNNDDYRDADRGVQLHPSIFEGDLICTHKF